jgi:hypothetical protein
MTSSDMPPYTALGKQILSFNPRTRCGLEYLLTAPWTFFQLLPLFSHCYVQKYDRSQFSPINGCELDIFSEEETPKFVSRHRRFQSMKMGIVA